MGRFQTRTAEISMETNVILNINDLDDDDITSKVWKFAEDTKKYRQFKSDAYRQHLQDDLNKLTEWSEKWQMLFRKMTKG